MIFVTFQPIGYENMSREAGLFDCYAKHIGFEPIYAICAESLLSAVMGTCIATPTIPEQAIFFKAKDYHVINLIPHSKFIFSKGKDEFVHPMPRKRFREIQADDTDFFFRACLSSPYEFLINPKDMKIIKTIDIKKRFEDTISEGFDRISDQQFLKEELDESRRSYELEDTHKPWDTLEMRLRSTEACHYWALYAWWNDVFIGDYESIVGYKDQDYSLSMDEAVHTSESFCDLRMAFDENPGFETYEKYVDYFIEHIIQARRDALKFIAKED